MRQHLEDHANVEQKISLRPEVVANVVHVHLGELAQYQAAKPIGTLSASAHIVKHQYRATENGVHLQQKVRKLALEAKRTIAEHCCFDS